MQLLLLPSRPELGVSSMQLFLLSSRPALGVSSMQLLLLSSRPALSMRSMQRMSRDLPNHETKMYTVYILTNKPHGTLYVGVTSNLVKRVWEHRNSKENCFTKKYNLHKLVYFETLIDIKEAIAREKSLKQWKRPWKIELVDNFNPDWKDLYQSIC